ncbi:MAG: hypothetical protein HY999_02765 [Nitrospinae bacterium]|nr:hypothetical protein [Nitrospinota bacterium]
MSSRVRSKEEGVISIRASEERDYLFQQSHCPVSFIIFKKEGVEENGYSTVIR